VLSAVYSLSLSSCHHSSFVPPSPFIESELLGELSSPSYRTELTGRQRDADRAPPMVVLSLPERIWTPDIVWEKDDSSSEPDSPTPTQSPKSTRPPFISMHSSFTTTGTGASSTLPPPPPISASEVADPPITSESSTSTSNKPVKVRRKSQKYYSKDECAICMDSFHRGEVVRILPCGHVFHKDECDEWLMKWRKLVSFHLFDIGTRN